VGTVEDWISRLVAPAGRLPAAAGLGAAFELVRVDV
jgi:hypothetical protein